jgi:hypothetical protein
MLDSDVLVSDPSQLIELLTKSFVVNRLIAFALGIQHADEPKLVRPGALRAAKQRQRCQKESNELASPHMVLSNRGQ